MIVIGSHCREIFWALCLVQASKVVSHSKSTSDKQIRVSERLENRINQIFTCVYSLKITGLIGVLTVETLNVLCCFNDVVMKWEFVWTVCLTLHTAVHSNLLKNASSSSAVRLKHSSSVTHCVPMSFYLLSWNPWEGINSSTAVEAFELSTERRAKERQEYERLASEKEALRALMEEQQRQEEEKREKEEIARLRQEQVM